MKTKEELNALRNKPKALNAKPAALSGDELGRVTGGAYSGGVCGPDNSISLDRILSEVSAWLDVHPNATKSDISNVLNNKKAEYADELTADELRVLEEIITSFAA